MKSYKIFEVNDTSEILKGQIKCRLDDDDKTIFKQLKTIGFKVNKRKNKLVWWNDEYIEIINKNSDKTIGVMEVCY